jgi:hypothetical protein
MSLGAFILLGVAKVAAVVTVVKVRKLCKCIDKPEKKAGKQKKES